MKYAEGKGQSCCPSAVADEAEPGEEGGTTAPGPEGVHPFAMTAAPNGKDCARAAPRVEVRCAGRPMGDEEPAASERDPSETELTEVDGSGGVAVEGIEIKAEPARVAE